MRLVYVAAGWTAGIVLAANNQSGSVAVIWLALVALALVAARLLWPDQRARLSAAVLVAFTLGGLRMAAFPVGSEIARYNNSGGLSIEGIVVAEPDRRDARTDLRVAAETVTRAGQTLLTSGTVLVRAPYYAEAQIGDRVLATGRLITPGEFDLFSYGDYLARSGVFSIMRDTSVEVLEPGAVLSLQRVLSLLKARARQVIARHLPEPQAGLLTGILLGDESGIAPETEEAFSRAGASHVIAISGFNMVILGGVVMGLLRHTRLSRGQAAVAGILVIGLYALLVSGGAAVWRAALMSSLLIAASALKRRTYVPASLALAAVVLSLENPTVLWDIGFQLSFFATLGLALYVDPLSRQFDRLMQHLFPRSAARAVGRFLSEPLLVTLAVQITTLPLIALYFSRLSVVALLTNLLIVPVQAVILVLGLAATGVGFILPALAQVLFWHTLVFLAWTTDSVRGLARLPFADLSFPVDPRWVTIYFVILGGIAFMHATQPSWAQRLGRMIRQRAILGSALIASVTTLLLAGAAVWSRPDGQLHLWFLDVGHSNAVLIQSPGGSQILIDGGRFPSRLLTALGQRMPFYDREIEIMLLTQPDENEYSALTAVLARYQTGVVLTNGQPNLSPGFMALQEQLAGRRTLSVTAGYEILLDDGARLEILHPAEKPTLEGRLDDHSVVLRVTYEQASFLLTADLSPDGQRTLLASGQWPQSVVMQVPQHGAVRSIDPVFLDAVQPQIAVLQADKANPRGDPDPDTLALLGSVPLFRTDQTGTLHLWTDGVNLWVEPAT
jgi:competence protein ComEC